MMKQPLSRKSILILNGHPDPSPERLCHALTDAYATGAESSGHIVKRFDIGALDIPFLSSTEAFEGGAVPLELEPVKSALLNADHLVIIYPLWLGMLPAKLKACLEQVIRPGVAISYDGENRFPRKLLKDKTARVIVTMGMPSVIYRLIMRSHSLRALKNNILKLCGIKPVRTVVFGMVEAASNAKRKKWIMTVHGWGKAAK